MTSEQAQKVAILAKSGWRLWEDYQKICPGGSVWLFRGHSNLYTVELAWDMQLKEDPLYEIYNLIDRACEDDR